MVEVKKTSAKAIIDSINKIKIKFVSDIPDHDIKDGDVLEFPESEAKKIVKTGIAVFYDSELQKEYEDEDTGRMIASTFLDKKEMAHNFMRLQPIFYDESCLFWMWNKKNKKWKIVDETDILNRIDSAMPLNIDTIQSKHKQEIIESIKRVGRESIPKPVKKTWIQFKDRIVDIETGEMMDATPKYHIVNPIPWNIGETEETPTMDKIFEEWVGKDYVKTLYEIIAYCTLPDYPIHRLFCFVGSGLNGKSKFLELVVRFVGHDNATNTELDTLLSSRFEVSKIYKKLVCIMGETNYSSITKTSLLKRLTGQDQIGYEFKNKNPFDDYNYAKILISTNSLPMTEDKTLGFYRRWMIVNFPNSFSEKKDILEDIPECEYENLAKKVTSILKSLLEIRGFHNEGSLEERSKKYEDISNPLQKFMEECTELDSYGKTYKWEFRSSFVTWMIKRGYREWSEKELSIEMKKKGFEEKRDSEGDRWRYWCGIVLKKSVQDVQDVHSDPTQRYRGITNRNTMDKLDKLDKLKRNEGINVAHHIDYLIEKYNFTIDEITKMKEEGIIMEVTPNFYKIV